MIVGSKYVSVNSIILGVYRNMGMTDQIAMDDAVEWAGEAIELIGGYTSFVDMVDTIEVKNNRAPLPCGLHFIITAKGSPMKRQMTKILDNDCKPCGEPIIIEDSSCSSICEKPCENDFIQMRYTTNSYHHDYCKGNSDSCCNSSLTYDVNDDFIHTSFSEGYVKIAYKSIKLDENGYPMIPDNVKYRQAVMYHISWKLAFIKLLQGKITQAAYNIIERDRDWYIGAANSASEMPSVDRMESIMNNWLRLIPKINQHSDGHNNSGEPEQRYTHNSY